MQTNSFQYHSFTNIHQVVDSFLYLIIGLSLPYFWKKRRIIAKQLIKHGGGVIFLLISLPIITPIELIEKYYERKKNFEQSIKWFEKSLDIEDKLLNIFF